MTARVAFWPRIDDAHNGSEQSHSNSLIRSPPEQSDDFPSSHQRQHAGRGERWNHDCPVSNWRVNDDAWSNLDVSDGRHADTAARPRPFFAAPRPAAASEPICCLGDRDHGDIAPFNGTPKIVAALADTPPSCCASLSKKLSCMVIPHLPMQFPVRGKFSVPFLALRSSRLPRFRSTLVWVTVSDAYEQLEPDVQAPGEVGSFDSQGM